MPKKSRQKVKYVENEKSIWDEKKAFFIIFEGLSLKQIKIFFGGWESEFNYFWAALRLRCLLGSWFRLWIGMDRLASEENICVGVSFK